MLRVTNARVFNQANGRANTVSRYSRTGQLVAIRDDPEPGSVASIPEAPDIGPSDPPRIRGRHRGHRGWIVHPRERLIVDEKYPTFDPDDPETADIVNEIASTRPISQERLQSLGRPLPAPPRYRLGAHAVVINGSPSRKRRAEDSELDLVAADQGISDPRGPIAVTRQGGPSVNQGHQAPDALPQGHHVPDDAANQGHHVPDDAANQGYQVPDIAAQGHQVPNAAANQGPQVPDAGTQPAQAPAPGHMFGRLPSPRTMLNNIRSTISSFGNFFSNTLPNTVTSTVNYTVTEVRDVVYPNGQTEGHVRNKRMRIEAFEASELPSSVEAASNAEASNNASPRWVNKDEMAELLHSFDFFKRSLLQMSNCARHHPSRPSINRILWPLLPALVAGSNDEALVRRGERSTDLSALFRTRLRHIFDQLEPYYAIVPIMQCTKRWPDAIPESFDWHHRPGTPEALEQVKRLLSAPAFPSIAKTLLGMYPSDGPTDELSAGFTDALILDLEAMLNGLPMPSYIVSPYYHALLRDAYPRPNRSDFVHDALLPGSFPEDEPEPTRPAAQQNPPTPPPSPPVAPTRPHIEAPKWKKVDRIRAEFWQESIPKITTDGYNRHFYKESQAHRNIKRTYLTGAHGAHNPVDPRNAREIGSILKQRRNQPSQNTPKRLASIRRSPIPVKSVRFADETISPRPRSREGLELPRRAPKNGLRYNPRALGDPLSFERPRVPKNSPLKAARDIPVEEEVVVKPGRKCPTIDELLNLPSALRISDDRHDALHIKKVEAEEKALEEARLAAEKQAREELAAKLARTGGLREPKRTFVTPINADWGSRAQHTLVASATTKLATTAEGVELRSHDFSKVVLPTEWLNDEIVNGSLTWLDRAINSAAGIKDVKKKTRKCLAMSSFFLKRLQSQGVTGTQRTLRRSGVDKKNLLDVDTILVPICEGLHWTLLVIRPSKKTVSHMDSMNPRSIKYTKMAMDWMKDVLEETFVEEEWRTVHHEGPRQTNGYDCGVFTITNAMCLALGLHPIDTYEAEDMPAQRLRIACMLLNGGFHGDFDLRDY